MALRIARAVVVVLAAAQLALYLVLALRTVAYPFPLEWMEGGTLDVVARVAAHQPLYTRPNAEYVPYIYPPLYYWVSAQAARVVGMDFLAPRLVSFASVCAVFVLIAAIVRRSGGDRVSALAGAALFAGTYESTERWFHLARVDSLFLALLLAGVYALQTGTRRPSAILAGVLFFLSALTKQTMLMALGPLLLIGAIRAPLRPVIAGAVFAALAGATQLWMHAATDGWWTYFLFRLPLMHGPAVHGSYWFWRYDVVPVLPFALPMVAALAASALVGREYRWRWILALCVAGVGASWAARLHSGGAANSLMPAYAALAVAMPIGLEAFRSRPSWRLGGFALIAAQLALLLHAWTGTMPSADDRAAGERYIAFLRGIDGEVLNWHQRFLQTRAGKRSWGLEMAAEDVIRAGDPDTTAAIENDVIRRCRDGSLAGVIDPPPWLIAAVTFDPPVELFGDANVFRPVAGAPKRPERYFPIARHRAAVHRPGQGGDRDEVHPDAQQPKRPAPE